MAMGSHELRAMVEIHTLEATRRHPAAGYAPLVERPHRDATSLELDRTRKAGDAGSHNRHPSKRHASAIASIRAVISAITASNISDVRRPVDVL